MSENSLKNKIDMKKRFFLILSSFLVFGIAFSQTIADFETSTTYSVQPYGYTTNPAITGNTHQTAENTSANVLQINKDAGTFDEGTKVLLNNTLAISGSSNAQITLQVYTTVTGANLFFKFGNLVGGTETQIYGDWVGALTPNAWNTITVNVPAGTTAIDYIYLHPGCWDNNNVCAAANGIYFVDNLKLISAQPSSVLVDFETSSAFSFYPSSNYAVAPGIVANPHQTGINTSAKVYHIAKDKGTFDSYTKILFKSPQTVPAGAKRVLLDIWTSVDSSNFFLKVGTSGSSETFITNNTWMGAYTGGAWTTLAIDITNPSATIDEIYLYPGCSKNSNACPTGNGDYWIDNIRFDMTTSLNKSVSSTNQISVYPNPVNDQIIFSNTNISTVNIYDVIGSLVLSKAVTGKTIYVSDLSSGVYFIQARGDDNQIYIGKFIKK